MVLFVIFGLGFLWGGLGFVGGVCGGCYDGVFFMCVGSMGVILLVGVCCFRLLCVVWDGVEFELCVCFYCWFVCDYGRKSSMLGVRGSIYD